jgi:flagellar hook-basal body complex protein FliE
MSVNFIKPSLLPNLNPIKPITGPSPAIEGGKPTEGSSFAEALGNALKEVDNLHKGADKEIAGLVMKEPGSSPHEAMIALEKADMAFQMMNQIRTKIIRAYEEVMRTTV